MRGGRKEGSRQTFLKIFKYRGGEPKKAEFTRLNNY